MLLWINLVTPEMGIIQVIRRRFGQSLLSNRWLVGAVAASLALQLLVLSTPVSGLFDVSAVDLPGWTRVAPAVAAVIAVNYALSVVYDRVF